MTSQFILWGLVGYVAFYLIQAVKPARTKSGWDFVMEVGILAVACLVVSRFLIDAGTFLCPAGAANMKSIWPRQYSFTFALGFPVAVLLGLFLGATYKLRARALSTYHRLVNGADRNFEYTDIFFATCAELLSKMVLVTLKSGKVYVGILVAATQDPNEAKRYVRIVPVLSGFREKDSQKVVYNTFYDPITDPRTGFLISADEVSVLAPFSFERFRYFANVGAVRIDLPATPPPDKGAPVTK